MVHVVIFIIIETLCNDICLVISLSFYLLLTAVSYFLTIFMAPDNIWSICLIMPPRNFFNVYGKRSSLQLLMMVYVVFIMYTIQNIKYVVGWRNNWVFFIIKLLLDNESVKWTIQFELSRTMHLKMKMYNRMIKYTNFRRARKEKTLMNWNVSYIMILRSCNR